MPPDASKKNAKNGSGALIIKNKPFANYQLDHVDLVQTHLLYTTDTDSIVENVRLRRVVT